MVTELIIQYVILAVVKLVNLACCYFAAHDNVVDEISVSMGLLRVTIRANLTTCFSA